MSTIIVNYLILNYRINYYNYRVYQMVQNQLQLSLSLHAHLKNHRFSPVAKDMYTILVAVLDLN